MSHKDSVAYNVMILVLGKHDRIEDAWVLFNRMPEKDSEKDFGYGVC